MFIRYVNSTPASDDVKTTNVSNKKNRVLLVDDEPDIVYLIKRGLERNKFEVDAYMDPY